MKKTNQYPLRKIVGYDYDEKGFTMEVLECRHRMYPRRDFIGETNANKRRCKKCFEANLKYLQS